MLNNFNYLSTVAGNFASYMKNYTPKPLYGVNIVGNQFTIWPEYDIAYQQQFNVNSLCGIQVASFNMEMANVNTLASKWYKSPIKNYPLYIEELNVVLFATETERKEKIKSYNGDPTKLVKAYASGMVAIINATYTAITALNIDKKFYMLNNGSIQTLPSVSKDVVDDMLKKYQLEKESLDVNYIFIISTVLRNINDSENSKNEVSVNTDIKTVKRNMIRKGEPLINDTNGLVIFENRENAEYFVHKYGSLAKYMMIKAMNVTKAQHEWEINDINEQARRDKKNMAETFALMGGTSIASILAENVIRTYSEPGCSKDKTSKALKIFAVGIGGILSVYGLYKLGKMMKTKFEDKKQEFNNLPPINIDDLIDRE